MNGVCCCFHSPTAFLVAAVSASITHHPTHYIATSFRIQRRLRTRAPIESHWHWRHKGGLVVTHAATVRAGHREGPGLEFQSPKLVSDTGICYHHTHRSTPQHLFRRRRCRTVCGEFVNTPACEDYRRCHQDLRAGRIGMDAGEAFLRTYCSTCYYPACSHLAASPTHHTHALQVVQRATGARAQAHIP